jgi:predicted RND superfamily exporter protein
MLRSEPLIGHPLSIATILKALPGEGTILEKKSLIEVIPPPMKERFFSIVERPDKDGKKVHQGHASIYFQCQDLGTAAYKSTFERIEAALARIEAENPHVLCTLSGDAINRYRNLYKVVTDLATSLGGAALVSFFVLGFAYRSLRLGLIAIVPNVLPLLASAAYMVIAGMPLEITSICCFTICLGIAVDDTIHFMSRYQDELKRGGDHREAIERAFQAVGSGMIMTTIVLVAGFSSVLFSDISDFRTFGSLGIITFLIALTCDILLLPALLSRFDRPKAPVQADP